MASILRSSKFVRYFAGFARNLVFSTARETESSFVQQSQCLCGNLTSGFATAATKSKSGLDRSLKRLDDDVRRSGRISRRDLEEVLEEIRINRSATSAQSLLVIRCCGNLVPEELPEVRTALVQEIWKTLKNLNVAMDVSHYNALLRVYLDNEHAFSPTEFLTDMQSKGIEPNRVTYQRLISRYCQQGDIEGATRILEFMREKQLPVNEYVFNALIMGHSQSDDLESATGILAVMAQAGLQPSADTYTTLLCGYARKGDIDYICKTMDSCEQKEIFLLDKDILEIIYSLATNGHSDKVDRLLEKIRRQAGYNQDAVNVILRLINRGQEEVGMKLLRTMPRASRNDGELANTGSFLVRQLVRAKRPTEKVIAMCKELQDSNMNDRAYLIALETALKGGSVEMTFALLEELVRQNQPIRQHYFWPLLCFSDSSASKEERTDRVLHVLRSMVDKFGLYPSSETVREYAVPNLPVSNSEIVIQLLRSAGISLAVASSSCAFVALERNNLKEAANIALRYRAYYSPGVYRKPLVQALFQTRDYDAYVRFARAIYDGLKRVRSLEEESEHSAEGDGNGNNIESLQAETIGALIFDAVTIFKTDRVEMMQRILTGFVNQGLSISNGMAERIQERMGSEMTAEISSMLSKLAAGELEPIEVERTPNATGQARQGRPPIASLSVPQLERLVADLEACKENANSVKSQLIRSVIRSNDLAKTNEVLQKLEAENFIISPGVYGMVIELHATNGKVEEAFELLKSVKAKQPDFTLDRVKVVRLAQSLLETERFEEALQFLQENAATVQTEPPANEQQGNTQRDVNFVYNSACWRLLNLPAERGNVQQVSQLFDLLIAKGYIKPQTNFLGSLIKVHLVRDDLSSAMNTFADICQKYRLTPWKTELTCRLIQAEDATNLQRLTDLSTEVHGEVNSLYDLVFAFVDCGRIRQARKILETPGLRTRYQRIQTACERYQQEGKTASLEGLMEATKDLNHIDRSEIYHKLLQSYIGEKDADKALGLWTRMQEESVSPSDAFLTELGDFLKSNGYDVPFAVPASANVKTGKENKTPAASTTVSIGSSSAQATSSAKIPPVSSPIRELKQAIKSNNPDRILAAYEALDRANAPKPNLTEQSAIIEALVNRDRLTEASKLVLGLLEQQLFPVPRTFKYFLNKLAINGDVATFERIGALITDNLKRQISFDNRLCHANVSRGNADQYLRTLETAIEQAKSKEEATVAAKHFPIGGASGILSQHPELHERYEKLAENYAKWGLLAPVNALWIHYFTNGSTEKAQSIWDRHLKDSSRIMFQKIIQQARETKDDELCRRLIALLHDSNVSEKGKGLLYSCLIDTLVAKERPDEALAALEEGLKVTCLENVNRTALKRLQESLTAKGKTFPHTIPARNAKAAQEPSSTSSSDSDSESSSDEEPAKKAVATAGKSSSKPINKNLS